MPNPFDQFDSAPATPATGANPFDQFDSASAPAAPPNQWLAGAVEGITGALGTAANLANPASMVAGPVNALSQRLGGPEIIPNQVHSANKILGAVTGYNPENVSAATPHDRLIRSIATGLTGALIPGEEGFTVANMIRNATIGAGGAATGATAAENVPEQFKPAAQLVGNVVGALATHGAMAGAARTADVIAGASKRIVDPYIAAVSPAAAETQAAAKFSGQAKDISSVKAMLETAQDDLVPGSPATTAQLTGDTGLLSGERAEQVRNPADYAEIRGAQNEARTAAIKGLEDGGDTMALPNALKAQFDALDAQTAQHVADLTTKAQSRAAAIGVDLTPDAHGELVRNALDEAETAAKARSSGLYKAVPENASGNMQGTSSAAADIIKEMPPTAKSMSGEEASIFQAAQDLPPVAPVRDLLELRERVGEEMRSELSENGSTKIYRRLTRLRGAIQNNIANSLADQIQSEAGPIARGEMDPDVSTASRLQGWVDEFNRNREQAAAGAGGAESASAVPAEPAPSNPGANGAGLPPEGGLPGAPGDQGLPANAPVFTDEDKAALRAAETNYRGMKQTFGAKPIAAALARAGTKDAFKLPEANVPEKFFHPGVAAFGHMQALAKAIGEGPAATLMKDFAATSLRRAAMGPDGVIDPAKFVAWQFKHQDALRALPQEVRDAFSSASRAGQAVADAAVARRAALKAVETSSLGKIMNLSEGQDVTRAVGQILNRTTSHADMKALAEAARKAGPDAISGLRAAIRDHIIGKLIGNTEVGASGLPGIKEDQFQTFMKTNRPALGEVFSQPEIDRMQAVSDDIMRAKRSLNAVKIPGGSNTAQDTFASKAAKVAPRVVTNGLALIIGHGLGAGLAGEGIALLGANALMEMRNAGITRVDQLVSEAYKSPAVARELLQKAPVVNGRLATSGSIAAALRRAAITSGIVQAANTSNTVH